MKDFFAHWEIPAEFVGQAFLYSSLSNWLSKTSGLSLTDLQLLCIGKLPEKILSRLGELFSHLQLWWSRMSRL